MNRITKLRRCHDILNSVVEGETPLSEAVAAVGRMKKPTDIPEMRDIDRQQCGAAFAAELTDALNRGEFDAKSFITSFCNSHRTLQQKMFRELIVPLIVAYAKQESFDDRNKNSVELCKKLSECIKESNIPLPFI